MKKNHLALSLLAAATLMVTACGGDDKGAVATAQAATTNSAVAISDQSSFEDKSSYAVGASVGTYIAQIESDQQDVLGKFNHDLVVKGFLDALENNVALDDKVMQETLLALDTKLREGIEMKQKAVAEKTLKEGTDFLAENAKKDGVKTTNSGLQYKVLAEGKQDPCY